MDINSINASSDPKSAILNQLRSESNLNNARQLIEKTNNHCFEKCIPSPGSSLSKKEEACLSMCMEKYMMAWNTVSRQYISRVQRSAPPGEGGGSGLGMEN